MKTFFTKCVFFDRDGIVNRRPGSGYVERWDDFHLLPGFVTVLRTVRLAGYQAVIVTNQRGVARGIMTRSAVEEIHRNLQTLLAGRFGLRLLDILYCPHDEGECQCRKPRPGMLLEAARRHRVDLKRSWMVGDSESDVEAGRRAGCRTVLVSAKGRILSSKADHWVPDLESLECLFRDILKGSSRSQG
ncbi:MAG: HAD family hydrolase [Kiritimatiellae bacterium]|nr:HAD family hydrolase [Kiritimatiellia bacterium]